MARIEWWRGAKAIAIATLLFAFCMWAGLGKNRIGMYFHGWQNTTTTVVFYGVFAVLVFWLFSRTRPPMLQPENDSTRTR